MDVECLYRPVISYYPIKREAGGLVKKTKETMRGTREKLLESALDVMSEKPFNTVSLDEIASRLGLTRGAVYWHFKNKSDLLVNLIRHLCENIGPDADVGGKPPENFGELRNLIQNRLKEASRSEHSQKMNKLFNRRYEWPEGVGNTAMGFITEMNDRLRGLIASVISRCQETGEMRLDFPVQEIATFLSTVFHEMFFTRLNMIFDMDFEKYSNFIFDAIEKELSIGNDTGSNVKTGARSASKTDSAKTGKRRG
jgi:TetR/AcrR family acrAB operon transcriptional repressor